jgi:glycosyltransferase involved in cell wall biosynthesis
MQANNKTIFLFGYGRYDHLYESVSFILAKEFAKNNHTVYYIDYPFTTRDAIRLKNTESYKVRKDAFEGKNDGILSTSIPNLNILIVPPLYSLHFLPEGKIYRTLLRLNDKKIAERINNIIAKENIKDYIFINSWVFHYPNVTQYLHIRPSLKIYHCIDPVIMPYDAKHGVISEDILVKDSDLVVCTSQKLCDEKKKVHPKTFFVSNAADIKHSILATDKNLPEYEGLAQFKKPIIGYFGNIEKRIDYAMLRDVALMNKDKSFVFAGPVEKEYVPGYIDSIDNIHFIGRIPYAQLPNVLKTFDVAIIPFRRYEDSATVFPMKLFEYLGSGKPVVATDFNLDLKNFTGELVPYCSTAEEFSASINNALHHDTGELRQARIDLAGQHTWESRAAAFEEIMMNA